MNEMQVFSNPEFGNVRTLTLDDAPWFVGKDVATALGYARTADALNTHVDEADKRLVRVGEIPTLKVNNYGAYIINESGLYSLILSSKLPSAKRFQRWVTSEVLPAIRKTGSYTVPDALPRVITPDDYLTAARIIAGCRNDRLPYVIPLIKKAGIDIDIAVQTALPASRMQKDPQTAKLLTTALNDHHVSIRALERLTGLKNTQLYRMRDGTSKYHAERAALIRDVIHALLPDLDIDAIVAEA